ncbi:phage tail tape measure protein [Aquabacterium sp.]|uniref:phage tail tape measure protein n=1 Tax=Aquabacterium sp. TaxID=1872578 RepID=UPI002611D381|nr:phage tail tape measure protein [Aquabacterium sp.]MDD2978262.1 phage tail tape measure protein [Aquabacterium sp.]
MANDLLLQVRMKLTEQVLGPLRKVSAATGDTAKALKEARDRLKDLNKQQGMVDNLRKQQASLASNSQQLKIQKALLQSLQNSGTATEAQLKKQSAAVDRQTEAWKRQSAQMAQMRTRANAMGIGKLSEDQNRLEREIKETTTAVEKQSAAFKAQAEQTKKLNALKAKHGREMSRVAMVGATGAAGIAAGNAVASPLKSMFGAFAEQESATTQLRASMMRKDGSVPEEFKKITDLATRLGDRLPGTTAEFQQMMTMLIRQGIQAKTILGGLGEAAAYLGVQLQMPVTEAAEFASKMQDATRTVDKDMMGLMDTIQRAYYLGVDSGNMLQGFTKMSPVMGLLRQEGLQAANTLAPLLVMMDQTGMAGESAGNAIRKVFQAGMDLKKIDKANDLLKDAKAGFKLDFTDGKGNFGGLDKVFAQIKKLQNLKDTDQTSVMKAVFGDDSETLQVVSTMMSKGLSGYQEVAKKMQAQADLRKRVDAELGTLANMTDAAQGSWTNAMGALVTSASPELKKLIEWVGELGNKVSAWADKNPEITSTLVMLAGGLAALLVVAGSLMLTFATAMAPMLLFRFALARIGITGMPLAGMFRSLGSAIMGLGRMLMANPIILFIAAIAAAAYLIYRNWDVIGPFFARLWAGITATASAAWNWIKSAFLNFTPMGLIIQNWGGITTFFRGLWTGITAAASAGWSWIRNSFFSFTPMGLIIQNWGGITTFFNNLWSSIVSGLAALPARLMAMGGMLMDGLVNGITSRITAVKDAIVNVASSTVGWFKEKLGIKSPSRVFMAAGGEISNGAAKGIESQQGGVLAAARGMATVAASVLPMFTGPASAAMPAIDGRPPITAASASGRAASAAPAAGNTYAITIQAAPGMDPQAIARAVSAELDRRERSRQATGRSQLADRD